LVEDGAGFRIGICVGIGVGAAVCLVTEVEGCAFRWDEVLFQDAEVVNVIEPSMARKALSTRTTIVRILPEVENRRLIGGTGKLKVPIL